MTRILLAAFLAFLNTSLTAQCWKAVTNGDTHTLAIRSDGSLWAWGNNDNGKLGTNSLITSGYPIKIGNSSEWKAVSAGENHSLGLKNNGTLWAWGSNEYGQLGDSVYTAVNVPVQIGHDTDWVFISAGLTHSHAIKRNGTLWAWGRNIYYILGNGTATTSKIPIQIGTDTNWKCISSMQIFSMAIKNNGELWGWGNNNYGQTGLSTSLLSVLTPSRIGTDNDWDTISTGYNFCLAIKKDSSLWTWGNNYGGQLGRGLFYGNTNIPEKINDEKWKLVAAGMESSYAIRNDGTLWAWGDNERGFLGLGPVVINVNDKTYFPAQVGSDSNWQCVFSKRENCSGLRTDHSLWGWGVNWFGEVGDGTTITRNIPVPISCPNVLPVTLVSFNARKLPNGAMECYWETNAEYNSKKYEIEVSRDAIHFSTLGAVQSQNNSNGAYYSFYDNTQRNGRFFFRLKCIDADNRYMYSNIVTLNFTNKKSDLFIYPVPATTTANAEHGLTGMHILVSLYDMKGRLLKMEKAFNQGTQKIDLTNLQAGIYTITLSDGYNTVTGKIIRH